MLFFKEAGIESESLPNPGKPETGPALIIRTHIEVA